MANKSKYDEFVKPHLKEIREWARAGATDKEICEALGVAYSTFCEYKNKRPELKDSLRTGRKAVVIDIKAALLKKALGFHYLEEKSVARKDKDGEDIVSVEQFKRYCPPDPTAAAMLLRNYDETWRDKDTATTNLKKQEMELKKAIAESNNFDLQIGEIIQ